MKLWKRAAGALKDRNSIWAASLSRRTPYRHPDLETLVIKATSHDESSIDYKSARRVFQWIRTSPIYLKPLAWALTNRMEKTRSWVVALKGLILMHGIFCTQLPAVQRIGRLPFDLSTFSDSHSPFSKTWGYNAFVRSYYDFLDQKSAFLSMEAKKKSPGKNNKHVECSLIEELTRLQKWQTMLDMLLHITPHNGAMSKVGLILEAMNNLVIEIFDVYGRICNGIAHALLRIYASPTKVEAAMALNVIQKASRQVEDLSVYFEICREMGALNASECPKLEQIPEEDIRELERIINGGVSNGRSRDDEIVAEEEKAVVVARESEIGIVERRDCSEREKLKTIITDKWEVFDGESTGADGGFEDSSQWEPKATGQFAVSLHVKDNSSSQNLVLPDLITF